VLKLGSTLLLVEPVRGPEKIVAWIQDALVPPTTRCMGNCHWNRATEQFALDTGCRITRIQQLSRGLQPMLVLHATRLETHQELP
jgi:hypothetical protein